MILVPTNCSSVKRATNNLLPKEIYCHITSAVTSNRTQHIVVPIVGRNTSTITTFMGFCFGNLTGQAMLFNIFEQSTASGTYIFLIVVFFSYVGQVHSYPWTACYKIYIAVLLVCVYTKIHVCECGKSYSYVYALRRHEKSYSSSVAWTCWRHGRTW
jgi:hypothetical protein